MVRCSPCFGPLGETAWKACADEPANRQSVIPTENPARVARSAGRKAVTPALWILLSCVIGSLVVVWALYSLRSGGSKAHPQADLGPDGTEREGRGNDHDQYDTLLQSLQGLVFLFQSIANDMATNSEIRRRIELALDRADSVLAESTDLPRHRAGARPPTSLPEALKSSAAELIVGDRPAFDLSVRGAASALRSPVAAEMLVIAEEAIRNTIRRATATRISASLAYSRSEIVLRVDDDGGRIPTSLADQEKDELHYGLIKMREHAELTGGQIRFRASVAGGTEVKLIVPGRIAYREGEPRFGDYLRSLWWGAQYS
jgi:hypothetical protein